DYRDESSKDVIRFTISSISDEYLPQSFIKPQSSNDLPDEIFTVNSGDVETEYVEISTDKKLLKVKSSGKSQVRLNIAYFPAWEIVLDGKKIKPDVQNGLYIVELENGDHTIDINYRQTFIENVGTAISFISFLLLVLGIIKVWKRKLL
ncbi:MAG: 2 protein, partial [Patescibacteria group bacterium]|nr:2 protein [Patescibacteria group bacterium]